ncbi:polyprenyl synthetase family protein [Helicobacter pametensis]|uniref:polyprenyl synthetase family protein n=1 Tax=Helicobacter pametensis TaxID=95149 RepID=UPI00048478BD|nr:polyprenyl synthetase family protein [Helicobacter pametensis]
MQDVITTMREMIQDFHNPFLNQMFDQITHGKMLRSSMVLSIAPHNQMTIKLCAIIELIQLASLLHDDVIDESAIRRGKPSLNVQFGNKNAIMLGDALYAKAFFHLTSFPQEIAQSLSGAVCKLSNGEIYDVFLSQGFNASKEQYFLMIEEKTASLIASSAECAAILAGLESEGYLHYGKCLGIAFQIIDDILDITQSQEVLGKPSMQDFKEGKTTLPYLLLYENLPSLEAKEKLQNLCGKELSLDEKQWILDSMDQYQCIKQSQHLAQEIAKDSLSKLTSSYNPKLKEIINSMIQRSF